MTVVNRIARNNRGLCVACVVVAVAATAQAQSPPSKALEVPEETAPEQPADAPTALEPAVPEQPADAPTAPEETAPEQPADASTAPEQPADASTAPEETAIEQIAPEQEPAPPVYESEVSSPGEQPQPQVLEKGDIEALSTPRTQAAPTPFDRGKISVALGVGMAGSYTSDWVILGVGVGYYAIKGLEFQAGTSFWLFDSPFIATVTPGVRYVLHFVPKIKPYAGIFYRHYFVGASYNDTDALGGNAGALFMLNPMSYVGVGLVYEHFLDTDLFSDRDQVYPEIVFAFTF